MLIPLRRFVARLAAFLRPSRAERDLAREVEAHLALIEDEGRRRGLSADEARFAARRAFGGVEQAKEHQREERSFMRVEHIRQDLRYAVRTLRKSPGFTAVAVLTLMLGIGSATAIFSLADASLLHPLPFPQGDRLVTVNEIVPLISRRPIRLPAADLVDYEQQTHAFSALGGWIAHEFELSGARESERVTGARATPSLFDVLEVGPALGRTFTPTEDRDGAKVCVISHGLWQRWFGADPGVLGRTVDLDRVPYVVVGVMPRGFEFPLPGPGFGRATDVWVPMSLTPVERQARMDNWSFNGLARLGPGVTVAQGSADVERVARRIVQSLPAADAGKVTFRAIVRPLAGQVSGPVRPLVLVLLGAVGCLLLIACVNVTNLLLARSASRAGEFAVRVALGAGRRRLVQQLVIESLVIGMAAAAGGCLLAWWGVGALGRVMPARFALLGQAHFSWQVLLFAALVTVATAVAVGTAPGWLATSRSEAGVLKSRSASGGGSPRRLRTALVIVEVALTVMLLVGAGLLMRSFSDLLRAPAGFEPRGAVAGAVSLPAAAYPDAVHERQFYRSLLDRLQASPATEFAGLATSLPLDGGTFQRVFTPDGYTPPPGAALAIASMTAVKGAYLQAIGATLVRGRYFTPQDDGRAAPVALVNESVARQYWPGQSALGQRLRFGGDDGSVPWLTVVGVVADVKQDTLDQPAGLQIFVPMDQLERTMAAQAWTTFLPMAIRSVFVVVRGRGASSLLATDLRAAVRQLDPQLSIAQLQPLADVISASAAPNRFNMLLMVTFAVLALVLAAVGVFGVIAYSVAQRTQEIGIRLALGADAGAVARMVLRGGVGLALAGVAIGGTAAAGLAPLLRSLLYGVGPFDPPTFIGAALVLLGVAAAATYVPARRASRIDPQVALRSE
ncbi:MAG: ABC transporter permease [Acidobacteriota bacterium]|nr:ABC transporter permease [Acidobacteriota bacterium]